MDRPLFRTDLVSRPIEAAGHRFIEVTDPDSGNSFRFYEVEYAIACAMDGERDVFGLADWAKIELGLDPSPDELLTVISTLKDLGYLEGVPAVVTPAMPEMPAMPEHPLPLDRPPPVGRPEPPPSPFDLPPHLAPGLSTDLSEHIPVRAADVKEAVRQSRQMNAVRPPSGALADDEGFDEEKTPAPPYRPAVRAPAAAAADAGLGGPNRDLPLGPSPVMPSPSTFLGHAPAASAVGHQMGKAATPAPIVLPDQPAEVSRASAAGVAPVMRGFRRDSSRGLHPASGGMPFPSQRRSGGFLPYLVVALVLSGLAIAAFWWFFLREESAGQGAMTANDTPPVAPSAVERMPPPVRPAPPPSEIVAVLEVGPSWEQEVKASRPGRIAWLAPAGGEIVQGAPLAKYDGYQVAEYAVREAQDSQRRYQEKLDQATARGDKQAMREAEGNVRRKQGDINRHAGELDKFMIRAPTGGRVQLAIKSRTVVTKDQVVAKILDQPKPRATFTLPPGTAHEASEARIVARSNPDLTASCKVESSEPGKLVVSCPTDGGLASGMEVVLQPAK